MKTIKQIKKLFVFIIGITIVLIGLALLILPGPGILTIILGLVVLATEFIWARILLDKVKAHAKRAEKKAISKIKKNNPFRKQLNNLFP
jgi:tellurite resistance protein TerC